MSQTPATPMRVLHVMASGARGGGADHLLGLLPALRTQGVHVQAAVGDDGPLACVLRAQGITTQTLSVMGSRISPLGLLALRRVCQAPLDIIHLHGTRAAFFAGLARGLSEARGFMIAPTPRPMRVYSAHGLAFRQAPSGPRRQMRLWAERIACRQADAVISVSRGDLADLAAEGFVDGRISAHIANAVDTARYAPGPKLAARRALGLADTAQIIGTTSRLVPQKAVGRLMDAVLALPHVHLVVIGEGPLRGTLETHPLRRQGRAHLLGGRDDVAAILPAFDVFALNSHWEGEPIALLEAMATGLACVATATPGAREILQEGKLGRLVPITDAPAMTAALSSLLADAASCEAYGQAGRIAMAQRSYAAQATRICTLYTEILSR